MGMYSYDQVLTDVRDVYEQLTGLPAPNVDVKKPNFPLPAGADPVALVQNEINYLNLCLINSGISQRLLKSPTWAPPAEIYETPDEVVISIELAGMTEKDGVTAKPAGGVLVVRGTRRFHRVSEKAQYHHSERTYGTFERLFPLPQEVSADDLKTRFADGILEITLPKAKKERPERAGKAKS
ncbi:MAG TPA: Hsp20/alpha crystallin family protein [Blastocatellia bacterium]|nr:Hsp20/alpha crystallin family protein [Blastocatellia bacterium]